MSSVDAHFTHRPERGRFVQTRFSEPEIQLIDREVKRAGSRSRAEFVRVAVGRFIAAQQKDRAA